MKVEQKGDSFRPVTITLETKEEALALWDINNCGSMVTYLDNWQSNYSKCRKDFTLKIWHEMFRKLDNLFPGGK